MKKAKEQIAMELASYRVRNPKLDAPAPAREAPVSLATTDFPKRPVLTAP